jgi:hypothetical protein
MLTSHPALVVPPECGFAAWLFPDYGAWGADEFADAALRARFVAAVAAARKFDTWELPAERVDAALAGRAPRDYAEACERIYRLYAATVDKPHARWGDKNNFYLNHIARLRDIWPAARFVHLVRDGRDVACSYREVMAQASTSPYAPALPTDIAKIAGTWAQDVRTIAEGLAGVPAADRFGLRYEDLTTAPEATLAPLCAFLGVAFDPAMLQFHQANREQALEPAATMDWKRRTTEPANPGTVGRHKALLSAQEIGTFEATAGAELRRHGYLA